MFTSACRWANLPTQCICCGASATCPQDRMTDWELHHEKDQNSKFKLWFLNAYHFYIIIKLKSCKLETVFLNFQGGGVRYTYFIYLQSRLRHLFVLEGGGDILYSTFALKVLFTF